jgi:hypothetical protein
MSRSRIWGRLSKVSQASKIKIQAMTVESLTKKIWAETTKSARLGMRMMRKMVQLRHKLA